MPLKPLIPIFETLIPFIPRYSHLFSSLMTKSLQFDRTKTHKKQ